MADDDLATPKPQQKKGFFGSLSLFQKALMFLFVIILMFVVVGIALGGIKDFYQFFFYLSVFVGVCVAGYIVIKATGLMFTSQYYSPRQDLKTKFLNMAVDYKPDNVNNLYFTGDAGKKRVMAGKIVGLLGLPYYTGEIKRDKDGKVVYSISKDFRGQKIPVYTDIKIADGGDTLFIAKKGFIFTKTHLIRANRQYHSTLNGDVEIYDINPIPYGSFEYPYKQMQETTTQVMVQNQLETILATHEHQHDLISQSVDSAIYFNPVYRYGLKAGAEIPEE